MAQTADVIVIGGGIAGASLAAELAEGARVVLLEREAQPGYHSTGRSAAIYAPCYGPPVIRALTRASGPAFDAGGLDGVPLTHPRGLMLLARPDQEAALAHAEEEAEGRLERIDAAEARRLLPILRPGYAAGALFDASTRDIDVDALHQSCLRRLRDAGGQVATKAEVAAITPEGKDWRIDAGGESWSAPVVVNAAGAWADEIAAAAGVRRIGLEPRRRSAAIVAAPEGCDPSGWPMVVDVDESFYIKPEAGSILVSPADATPCAACDAQPEDLDIAIGVDRAEAAFELSVRRIAHKWAGLRSFVADGSPVAGYAPDAPGFFWLAGQGGYGIQTAPALSRAAAALVRGEELPEDIRAEGVTAAQLAPDRPGIG